MISCVVRARDESAARGIAASWMETPDKDGDKPGGNDPEGLAAMYRDPEQCDCTLIDPEGERGMIHYHRRHG